MRKISLFIAAFAIAFVLIVGYTTASTKEQVKDGITETIVDTKAFTVFGQTFQVPTSWPSEVDMKILPMQKMDEGNATSYAFIQEAPPGRIVYWFIGREVDSKFTTKMLTQTLMLPSFGVVGCEHWVVNSDGTITPLECEEFRNLIKLIKTPSI